MTAGHLREPNLQLPLILERASMHVVRFQMHVRERLAVCLCLLAFLTAVHTLPTLSRLASRAVRRHDAVLSPSLPPLKKELLSRPESEEQARVAAAFASKSNRQRTRLTDILPSLQPFSNAQSADLNQRQPHLKSDKHLVKLPDAPPPLRLSFRPEARLRPKRA